MNYTPKFNHQKIKDRFTKAIEFVEQYVHSTPVPVSKTQIDLHFGQSQKDSSKYLKEQTKKRVGILRKFDTLIVDYAKRKGYKTVSAGHIHIPEYKTIDGVLYINTGDMCETGSFVIEKMDGEIVLIKDFAKFKG
mgnify:CR=1 FL=1